MARSEPHDTLCRVPGLEDHAPTGTLPPSTASELGEQRKRALLGAEIGHRETEIGVDYGSQAHIRKVMALSHDLGTDQHGAIGGCERRQDLLERPHPRRHIAIESQHGESTKAICDLALESLGPCANPRDVDGTAAGAACWRRFVIGAVVTDKTWRVLMQHQRDVARRAPKATTTGSTVKCERSATAIE